MNKAKFVTTSDKDMSNILQQRGFHLVCYDGEFWTFANSGLLDFSEEENKRINYTNNLII